MASYRLWIPSMLAVLASVALSTHAQATELPLERSHPPIALSPLEPLGMAQGTAQGIAQLEHRQDLRLDPDGTALTFPEVSPVSEEPDCPYPFVFSLGQRGPVVEYVQYRLDKLGYQIEKTGVYDAQTQALVKAFQAEHGLSETGWLGLYTSETLKREEKAQPPSAVAISEGLGVLQKGQRGEAIVSLQKHLQAEGYDVGVTGVFGEYTEQAVKTLQTDLSLTPTGQWGRTTQVREAEVEALLAAEAEARLAEMDAALWDGDTIDLQGLGNFSLEAAARHAAEKYQSVGLCYQAVYEAVTRVYGDFLRGHSAYMAAEYLQSDPRFEQVNVSPERLPQLPPGWIVVWGQSPLSPHGHISVSLGNGLEASDHINQQLTHLRGYTNVQVFRPRS